jgi:phage terminase large subunit-like protein
MIQLLPHYKELFYKPEHRYYIITGSRGSAKSFHIAYFLLWLTYEVGHTILFTRYTMIAAHISIIPEFLEKIDLLGKHNDFEITKTEIVNKHTKSKILFRGIKTSSGNQTANLKSIQGVTTFVIDEAEELTDENIFNTIDLSIRHKSLPNRVIMVMNPSHRTHFIYKRWFDQKQDDTVYIHTTYLDNIGNLSESFLNQAERTKQLNEERYNHLFLGHWVDSVEGLLWNRALLDRLRIDTKPQLTRIVVAIDPASTANKNSDETGIVVVGIDAHRNGYVLEDKSGRWTPAEWGLLATQAAKAWGADCIVAETNQGGDMVKQVIRNIDGSIRYKGVHATKGKYTRAEPVYNLYEIGKIFHVGQHPILELQMCTFNPNEGESPDRVDALVWGLTELLLTTKEKWGAI